MSAEQIKAQAAANRLALEKLARYMDLVKARPQGLDEKEKKELDTLSESWPEITKHLFGNETDQAISFIDICGITSNLADGYQSGRPADKFPTLSLLRSFQTALGMCAVNNRELEFYCFSDSGFIVGKSAEKVFLATWLVIGFLHGLLDGGSAIPLRGAMSYGKVVSADLSATLKVENFIAGPLASEALVKVAVMEKTKTYSGIRFFATESFKSALPLGLRDIVSNDEIKKVSVNGSKEEPFYEIYWMLPVLAPHPKRDQLLAFYRGWYAEWSKSDNPYRKEIAQSLEDMLTVYDKIKS